MREVKLPQLSMGVIEGLVVRWLVEEGSAVAEGEPFVEIDTDKAVAEVEAPFTGIVRKLLVAAGDRVEVGAPIAVIEEA